VRIKKQKTTRNNSKSKHPKKHVKNKDSFRVQNNQQADSERKRENQKYNSENKLNKPFFAR
jgi:hypothetical protein